MVSGLLLALSLGAAGVSAQAAVAVAPQPVRVDVVVTDARGQRVPSLTTADFTVQADGRRVPVDAVTFVGSAAGAPAVTKTRRFAIFLDDYHISDGPAAERVRESLARFVRDDLSPTDQLIVLRPLDSLLAIELTTERAAAMAAIAAFAPRRGDYVPRSDFERNFIAEAPARVEATRARVATAALRALITELAQAEGSRKTLIVVSEGFLDPGVTRGEDIAPRLQSVTDAANRANVAVYTLNPSAADPTGTDLRLQSAREALRALAADTGGVSFEAPPDPRAALLAARTDADGFYVVTFTPSGDETEQALEALRIAVSRRGTTVRAPKSFGRLRRPEPARVEAPSFLSPFSAQLPRRASVLIRPWFGLSRGADGKSRVSFAWEPAGRVPGDRAPAASPVQIALTVTTLDGQPVFTGAVAAASGTLSNGSVPSRVSFDTPPGRLLVQMAIQDLAARVIDRDVRDIVVASFSGPVSLGTAEVFRTRTAREQQRIAESSATATPIAARQFSRRERLLVRVPVFSNDVPTVSARLVSAFGSVMRQLPVTSAPGPDSVYQIDLPLASLAVGTYHIDIQASTDAGNASDRLTIRITP